MTDMCLLGLRSTRSMTAKKKHGRGSMDVLAMPMSSTAGSLRLDMQSECITAEYPTTAQTHVENPSA